MASLTKKLTSLLLLTAITLSTAACSSETDDDKGSAETTAAPVETTTPETEEPKILPELPDITFDNADFRFYQYTSGASPYFNDIWVEAADGDPINDAVFKRDSLIEETYGIKIVYTEDEYTKVMSNYSKSVRTDDDLAEVVLIMGHCVPQLYSSNVFYNLRAIEYLDFDKPWWNQDAAENFTLAGYLPFAISDMTVNDKGATGAVFFNKKLAEDYGVKTDFYKLVDEGKWTIDEMIKAAKMTIDDLDGDGERDDDDRYGIVTNDELVFLLFHAAGGRYVSKDDEGYPYYSFESEANYTAITYYLENVLYDENMTRNNSFIPNSKTQADMFKDDQGLFLTSVLNAVNTLREMESDFGIIPVPKYQESQEGYACSASVFGGNLITVPINAKNLDMIGVIVEALSAESKYGVIPAFYETVLKDKISRDEDSVRMLDIIVDSMVFDVGDYYCLASFSDLFIRITGSVYNSGNTSYPQRTSDVASFYAKYEKQIDNAVKGLIKIIDKWKTAENAG